MNYCYTLEDLTAGSPTNHPWKERKIIWSKPPGNYVPAVNLQGCKSFFFVEFKHSELWRFLRWDGFSWSCPSWPFICRVYWFDMDVLALFFRHGRTVQWNQAFFPWKLVGSLAEWWSGFPWVKPRARSSCKSFFFANSKGISIRKRQNTYEHD